MKKRISLANWIFGLFFGVATSFGYQLQNNMFVDLKSKWTYISILVIGLTAGILTKLLWGLIKKGTSCKTAENEGNIEKITSLQIAENEMHVEGPARGLKPGKLLWLKYSALIWICHFIVFLGVYPGFFVYDANEELMESINGIFTAHHPLIHVLSMGKVILGIEKAFGDINLGIAAFILFGMTITALTYGYLVYRLRSMGIKRIGGFLISLYFGIFPVLVMYSLCSSKDGVFGCFLILSVIFIRDMMDDPEDFFSSLKGPMLLTVSLTMMMLFRNNGVYALAAFAIFCLLCSTGSLFWKMNIPEQTDVLVNVADEKQEIPTEAYVNSVAVTEASENLESIAEAGENLESVTEASEKQESAVAAAEKCAREGRYVLRSLGIIAAAVALYMIVNGAMIKAVDAQTGEKKEMLSVPIMQLARTYVYELDDPQAGLKESASVGITSEKSPSEKMTSDKNTSGETTSEGTTSGNGADEITEDKAAIERYISVNSLAHYSYKISDMVKCGFNEEEYASDPAGFWKIWWKYAKKSPVTYLNAALGTSFGIWYPWAVIDAYKGNTMYTYTYGDSSYFGYEVEKPGWRDSKIPVIDEFYRWLSLDIDIQKMPVVHLFFSPGFMLWLYLFFMGYFIYDDIRVKSLTTRCACTKVGEGLYDPPHMRREVGLKYHENAECGSSVGVRSTKHCGCHLLTSKRVIPYLLPLMVIMTCLLGPASLVRYSFFLWALLPYVIVDIKKR